MERIPMTAGGYKALEDEINHLKNVERHEIIKSKDEREIKNALCHAQ